MTDTLQYKWHGFPAITLESDNLRVVIVPELGAKIVSLFDKKQSFEWLVPPMRPLRKVAYGADFVSQDMSGWDEMVPTIVSCSVGGIQYPDHGEVWGIPWKVEKAADKEAILSVAGVAWPYSFIRSTALIAPDCLELGYSIRNDGTSPFPFLWAAHPQFVAGPGVHIVLPPEVVRMVNVIEDDPAWGSVGETYPWPVAKDRQGREWRMNQIRPAENHTCRKFYLPPDQKISWAALVDEERRCQLRLSWSAADAPYFGLWVDEGTYNSVPAVAPEPSNGYYDGLDKAILNERVAVLAPGMEQRWKLQVRFTTLE